VERPPLPASQLTSVEHAQHSSPLQRPPSGETPIGTGTCGSSVIVGGAGVEVAKAGVTDSSRGAAPGTWPPHRRGSDSGASPRRLDARGHSGSVHLIVVLVAHYQVPPMLTRRLDPSGQPSFAPLRGTPRGEGASERGSSSTRGARTTRRARPRAGLTFRATAFLRRRVLLRASGTRLWGASGAGRSASHRGAG